MKMSLKMLPANLRVRARARGIFLSFEGAAKKQNLSDLFKENLAESLITLSSEQPVILMVHSVRRRLLSLTSGEV